MIKWVGVFAVLRLSKMSTRQQIRHPITDLQARPVELWLDSLSLAPKSRVHIRGILSSLWKFAMWKQDVPLQVNPITLVTIKDASKRIRQPRGLTVEQFRLLLTELHEPFGTMALVCVCFGLRISECLALRWSDVDWLNGLLRVERGIVEQHVDDVKTPESRQSLVIANDLLDRLKLWKQSTEFPAGSDWIFASPIKLGRQPYSYTGFWREPGSRWSGVRDRFHRHSQVQAFLPDVD
jgi:integrase